MRNFRAANTREEQWVVQAEGWQFLNDQVDGNDVIFYYLYLYTTHVQQEVEGTQWGRPGPGGTYWRPSAITGQGFMDKMVSAGTVCI